MKINRIYKELKGENDRLMGVDIHYCDGFSTMPIVLFAHGYKGFKDFGAWSIIADQMAQNGIVFIRFNFSHNGVKPQSPTEFTDLEAFANIYQNFTKVVQAKLDGVEVDPVYDDFPTVDEGVRGMKFIDAVGYVLLVLCYLISLTTIYLILKTLGVLA